jgi:micrococcal nuclease
MAIFILFIIAVLAAILGYGSLWYLDFIHGNIFYRDGAATTTAPMQGTYQVADVVDGDTIDVLIGEVKTRVRYIGMDTPETVDPDKPVECYGKEASERNKELVAGKTVALVSDAEDKDKYGRLLRYVYADGTFVNLELVKEGFATAEPIPPDTAHAKEFADAAALARTDGIGLWSACVK